MEASRGPAPKAPKFFSKKNFFSKKEKKKFKILSLNFLIFLVLPPQFFFSFQFGPSIFIGLGPPLALSLRHGGERKDKPNKHKRIL
jgi:hypothetical protein